MGKVINFPSTNKYIYDSVSVHRSRPVLREGMEQPLQSKTNTITIGVEGMVCKSCVNNIEGNVGKMSGVSTVKVSLAEKRAVIEYDPSKVSPRQLCIAIEDLGFEAKLNKDSFVQASASNDSIKTANIGIEGMTCHSCVGLIESTLRDMDGVSQVTVSLAKKQGNVEYDEGSVTLEDIKGAVGAMGFIVTYITGKQAAILG